MVVREKLSCHVLYLLRCDGIYLLVEVRNAFLPTIVQVALAEVEGEVLSVVAGHTYLPFDLLLGSSQLCRGERMDNKLLENLSYEIATTLHIVGIAAEVDAPVAEVAVGGEVALYGVYEAMVLA